MKRLIHHIPFIGKHYRRWKTAIEMIADEFGDDDEKQVLERIDIQAGIISPPQREMLNVPPYSVTIDWARDELLPFEELDKIDKDLGDHFTPLKQIS